MRFVSPKTEAQQTLSVLHRLRQSLVGERTKALNQMHGFLLEFGISLPQGLAMIKRLASVLAEHELPVRLTMLLQRLDDHFVYLDEQIKALDKELACQLADDDLGSRLLSLPCVGPITANLLTVEMDDGQQYACGRDFAASVGLVPRQYSTGGNANLLGISKRGDQDLRRLLVQCSSVYMQRLEYQKGRLADWVRSLLMRRHSNVVACALANKLARIAWAIAAHHTEFEAGPSNMIAWLCGCRGATIHPSSFARAEQQMKLTAYRPGEDPDSETDSRSRAGFKDRQVRLSSWRGACPNRRRIDLSKPTGSSVNQYCKKRGDHRFHWPGIRHGSEMELEAEQLQALVLGLPCQRVGSGCAITLL